jgi:heme A synthase
MLRRSGVTQRRYVANTAQKPDGENTMNLSAPTLIVFIISVVLAVIGIATRYAGVSLGLEAFHWALAGYIVLFLGNILKGL